MRFRIRNAVVESSLYIKHFKLTIMRFRIRIAVVENSFYIKYYQVNINALSNKDGGSGKLIAYKVL
jgi:hypothetical protein